MIVELKINKSAESALEQIKKKQYVDCLKDYSGTILIVRISYDKEEKKHTCKIELMDAGNTEGYRLTTAGI